MRAYEAARPLQLVLKLCASQGFFTMLLRWLDPERGLGRAKRAGGQLGTSVDSLKEDSTPESSLPIGDPGDSNTQKFLGVLGNGYDWRKAGGSSTNCWKTSTKAGV